MYHKDHVQVREITKCANNFLIKIKNGISLDIATKQYQEEINYWKEEYPVQIQNWEDEGGFVNENVIKDLYRNRIK